MDAREKAIEAITSYYGIPQQAMKRGIAFDILNRPELEAYFREKFENEPGRLVAERVCPGCTACKPFLSNGFDCDDTGTIQRRMTRKEVEEWAVSVVKGGHYTVGVCSNESVSVEEK